MPQKPYDVAERFQEVARRQKTMDDAAAARKKSRQEAGDLVKKRKEDDQAVRAFATRPGRHIHDKTDVNLPLSTATPEARERAVQTMTKPKSVAQQVHDAGEEERKKNPKFKNFGLVKR